MDTTCLCSIATPMLNLMQQLVNFSFGLLSVFGIQPPDVSQLLSPFLSCTTG